MKSILITGGAGYIGTHIVKKCLDQGWDVTVLDNFSKGYREPIDILKKYGELSLFETDLTNKSSLHSTFEQLYKDKKIDAVIHCAAFCSVGESMRHPEMYFDNNVGGTENLLLAMEKFEIPNIVFSSSCATYGEAQYLPIDEEHPLDPVNPYGKSKKLSEELIKNSKNTKYVLLRYFNVFGSDYESGLGDSKKPSPHLVQNAVRGVLGIEEFKLTFPKVETADKSPIRDYLDVRDLADAHISSVNFLDKNDSEVFNLGTGFGHSVLDIIKKIEVVLGSKIDVGRAESRPGEYAEMVASSKKAKELLGWEPKIKLEDSVLSLSEWYKLRPHGYKD